MDFNPEMKIIAHIASPFREKFGIPRQSGLAEDVKACIVFEPEFRVADALRGLEEFSHLWLIWQFSRAIRSEWSPTVRPPRLGGNTRLGVFATRSPFRPNPIGLSCVKLLSVDLTDDRGPVLWVSGADLMDGTPIYDIKPYIPYADCHPEAGGGFTDHVGEFLLDVEIPDAIAASLSDELRKELISVLSHDPRPSYHSDENREYGMRYGDSNVRFRVSGQVLTVISIEPASEGEKK